MDAADRRIAILDRLNNTTVPLPAAGLGEALGVSRQIIVGVVALLLLAGGGVALMLRRRRLAGSETD